MDTLKAGQQLNFTDQLESANGAVKLVMQPDSNLVLYRNDTGGVLWATNTRPSTGMTHVSMQSDGNLVLYSDSRKVGWASNTDNHPGASVKLGNDGNLVVSDVSGTTLWSTGTVVFPSAAESRRSRRTSRTCRRSTTTSTTRARRGCSTRTSCSPRPTRVIRV